MNRSAVARPGIAALLLAIALATQGAHPGAGEVAPPADARHGEAFRLGVLFDYTGRLGVHGPDLEQGVRLALSQVNAAGGVFGRPVELVIADGQTDSRAAVRVAGEMVDSGVHALVGPMGSQAALSVGRDVSGPRRLPTITPSATSPELAELDDGGFLFRTALSDVAQGPVLARLATSDGLDRLSVVYQDDTYGRGLYRAFAGSFAGRINAAVTVPPEADSYLDELRRAAAGGSQALLVIAYPGATDVLVAEALGQHLFDRFLFVDANFGPDIVLAIGAERLEGQMGTIPIAAGDRLPGYATVQRELLDFAGSVPKQSALAAYDATVCLCLAAERAGSTDGVAIRDALYEVCGGDGLRFDAGATGVGGALSALRAGTDVDFDGATSSIDWDAAGDVTRGFVGVYRFQQGSVVLVDRVAFDARLPAELNPPDSPPAT